MCEQLLLELLANILTFSPLLLDLLDLSFELRLKPRQTLHIPLGSLQMPSHGDQLFIFLSAHELNLSHLVLNLLILGPDLMFNQKLGLEILVYFLQLIFQHLVLLHQTRDLLLGFCG